MLPQSLFQTALSMSSKYNDVLAHAPKLIKDKVSTQKDIDTTPSKPCIYRLTEGTLSVFHMVSP